MVAKPKVIDATIVFKKGTTSEWQLKNPVLAEGEPGLELGLGNFKIGDGVTPWTDLEYFLTNEDVIPGDDGAAIEALQAHISSNAPHPVYDDGPSLLLLYQNAKV